MDAEYALFASIVETGSLSAAARRLLISPAMVSKRLARLEARLGVRLIQRTTRKLALTDTGARFHADVLAILRTVREAESRVTGVRDLPSGPLRVSAPTSFARLHIAPHLHDFLTSHPDVALELELDDAPADLFAGKTDLAIRITADLPASVTARRLCDNRRILCASAAYLAAHGLPETIATLNRHRLLAADGQMPWRLVNGGRCHAIDGRSYVRTNSSEIVRELAISGVGIALRSLWDVSEALAEGRLVPVLPDWEESRDLGIYALHPRAPAVLPAVTAFVEFLARILYPAPWEQDVA